MINRNSVFVETAISDVSTGQITPIIAESQQSLGRREFLRGLGVVAGLAVLAPVIGKVLGSETAYASDSDLNPKVVDEELALDSSKSKDDYSSFDSEQVLDKNSQTVSVDSELEKVSNATHSTVEASDDHDKESLTGQTKELFTDFPTWYEDFTDPDQTYVDSIRQDLVTTAASLAISVPLEMAGMPVGNAGVSELLADRPELLADLKASQLFYFAAVKAPIVEEAVYRAGPSAVVNLLSSAPSTSSMLLPAIASSAIFAESHNKGATKRKIPLGQFLGGMTLWRINRSKGYLHSVAAHAATNAVVMGLATGSTRKQIQLAKDTMAERQNQEETYSQASQRAASPSQPGADGRLTDVFDSFFAPRVEKPLAKDQVNNGNSSARKPASQDLPKKRKTSMEENMETLQGAARPSQAGADGRLTDVFDSFFAPRVEKPSTKVQTNNGDSKTRKPAPQDLPKKQKTSMEENMETLGRLRKNINSRHNLDN